MEMYQEIEKLKSIYIEHGIQIKPLKRANSEGFVFAEITIEKESWKIYIDDEYGDCSKDKPLVALFLMLFSLDVYHDSLDYLDWCNQNKINASDLKWLTYYKSLEKTYSELKQILGDLDPCIDPFDYQIRNEVIDALFASEV